MSQHCHKCSIFSSENELRFEHWGSKRAFWPGRHLTRCRPEWSRNPHCRSHHHYIGLILHCSYLSTNVLIAGIKTNFNLNSSSSSFERVVTVTAWVDKILGQLLSTHSIVSSSRTVRPCSPWGGRWIGHWKTTWSTVCSSAPHSQGAEEAIPHLYRQERKRPTPVPRRLSRSHAVLGRAIPRRLVPVSGMKLRSLVGLSHHSAFRGWSTQSAVRLLLLSNKLISCCAGGYNSVDKWGLNGAG